MLREVPRAKNPPGGNVTKVLSDAASTTRFQTLENAINTGLFVYRGFARAQLGTRPTQRI